MQKYPDYRGCFGGLQGIKIHFREFLYDFALKRNRLLGGFPCGLAALESFPLP
jgi:hypothetical protein